MAGVVVGSMNAWVFMTAGLSLQVDTGILEGSLPSPSALCCGTQAGLFFATSLPMLSELCCDNRLSLFHPDRCRTRYDMPS